MDYRIFFVIVIVIIVAAAAAAAADAVNLAGELSQRNVGELSHRGMLIKKKEKKKTSESLCCFSAYEAEG